MTDDRRAKRLETIRNLLSRAASTEFEAEREECLRQADRIQTQFQVEEWELAVGDDSAKGRQPIRREMDLTWYVDERKHEIKSSLWAMFLECAAHCRCIAAHSHADYVSKRLPVFGLADDLDYLDMLFTNLFMQMISKVRPKFDPDKSLGFNVYTAKEAGMKYRDIAIWAGHPEWIKQVTREDRYGYPTIKQEYDGIMIREMRKYAKQAGLEVHKEISLRAYLEDFCDAFAAAVNNKLRMMRDEQGQSTGSMAIALRDMRLVAREAMYEDFPDMRPHPADCDCDKCHWCDDPKCKRPRCVAARKPIPRSHYRNVSFAAQARGAAAGREAKIVGRGEKGLGGRRKELD